MLVMITLAARKIVSGTNTGAMVLSLTRSKLKFDYGTAEINCPMNAREDRWRRSAFAPNRASSIAVGGYSYTHIEDSCLALRALLIIGPSSCRAGP
jgi:hypothetical protein